MDAQEPDDVRVSGLGEIAAGPTKRVKIVETMFSSRLKRHLFGRVVVLGVGNRLRCDDGAGSWLAEQLAGRPALHAIDAGAVPENHLERVVRSNPDTVLILDAVDFGGAPGDMRILDPESVVASGFSTHTLSLQIAAEFLKARTQARVALLAIQPADVGMGTRMSAEMSRSLELLKGTLLAVLYEHMNEGRARGGDRKHP